MDRPTVFRACRWCAQRLRQASRCPAPTREDWSLASRALDQRPGPEERAQGGLSTRVRATLPPFVQAVRPLHRSSLHAREVPAPNRTARTLESRAGRRADGGQRRGHLESRSQPAEERNPIRRPAIASTRPRPLRFLPRMNAILRSDAQRTLGTVIARDAEHGIERSCRRSDAVPLRLAYVIERQHLSGEVTQPRAPVSSAPARRNRASGASLELTVDKFR